MQFYRKRLRQTDIKAGHFERKLQAVEAQREEWEQKYEKMQEKYQATLKELEEFQASLSNL
jgi:tropomyosin, fungi type